MNYKIDDHSFCSFIHAFIHSFTITIRVDRRGGRKRKPANREKKKCHMNMYGCYCFWIRVVFRVSTHSLTEKVLISKFIVFAFSIEIVSILIFLLLHDDLNLNMPLHLQMNILCNTCV